MSWEGWMMLALALISTFAFAIAWAAWISAHEAKREVSDLRYRLRRELGSDGL